MFTKNDQDTIFNKTNRAIMVLGEKIKCKKNNYRRTDVRTKEIKRLENPTWAWQIHINKMQSLSLWCKENALIFYSCNAHSRTVLSKQQRSAPGTFKAKDDILVKIFPVKCAKTDSNVIFDES